MLTDISLGFLCNKAEEFRATGPIGQGADDGFGELSMRAFVPVPRKLAKASVRLSTRVPLSFRMDVRPAWNAAQAL